MEKVGFFVSSETTLSLLLPAISGSASGPSTFRIGCLRALQGVLCGTSAKSLSPHLSKLLACLSDRDLTQNESVPVVVEVVKCFRELGKKLSSDPTVLFQFFFSLVHLESFPGDSKVAGWSILQERVAEAVNDHAVYQGTSIDMLYAAHFDRGVEVLLGSFMSWNQYSYEPRVLKSLLYKSGDKVGDGFEKIMPIFAECAKPEKDFELRQRLVIMETADCCIVFWKFACICWNRK